MYKIIKDNKVIDVVNPPRFLRFMRNGSISLTDKSSAQGIAGSDNYTIYSFKPVNNKKVEAIVRIEPVNEEEFNRLKGLLNSNKEISADISALELAKQVTIKRLSSICKTKITNGFHIKLSDGLEYHFKLTTEDQLNLMVIENQLNSGMESFIYHSTDQPCRFFSRDDMLNIIQMFKNHTLYHTTYFNAAKQYIKGLSDIEQVKLFTYGTDISDTVDSRVIKQILKRGGNFE